MTDKEMILHLIRKTKQEILYIQDDYMEVENPMCGESICIDFDRNGNIIKVY